MRSFPIRLPLVLLTLPLTLTLILVSAVALWLEGGRPFYTQDRLGKDGRRFRLFLQIMAAFITKFEIRRRYRSAIGATHFYGRTAIPAKSTACRPFFGC